MYIQNNDNSLNNKLEVMLTDGRREMGERKQKILIGINSHAIEAKHEVRQYISHLANIRSAQSGSERHRKIQ